MTDNKALNADKVFDRINSDSLWDDMYINIADDEDGVTYVIVDNHDSANKFIAIVKDTLGIDKDNFNDFDVENETGIIMVFSDEYTTCCDCGNIIRTEPDSYHWQPNFYIGDGFIVCNKCFNDSEDYQEGYIENLINNPKNAINGLMTEEQVESLGFKKIGKEYEDGWYHVNDDPEEILEKLSSKFEEVLFFINNVEQFRINFITFVRGERD